MNNRDETIKTIRAALKRRSGKTWSVTGGTGTAWGWITVDAPPKRRTAHWVLKPGAVGNPGDYNNLDTGQPDGHITPAESAELAKLLDLDSIHFQGLSIPASSAHYREYIARANGETNVKSTELYWD